VICIGKDKAEVERERAAYNPPSPSFSLHLNYLRNVVPKVLNHPGMALRYIFKKPMISGEPEECIERLEQYRRLGVSYFIMFPGVRLGRMEPMKTFKEKVMPHFTQPS